MPIALPRSGARMCVLAALGVLVSARADAQTVITGPTLTDLDWNTAGSPYLVEGSVWVPGGETLQIGPGTRVELAGSVMLYVGGSIVVNGTAASAVTFAREAPGADWDQIFLPTTAGTAEFRHVHFEGAIVPLNLWVDATVEHCTFTDASSAISVLGGTTHVHASLFDVENNSGISACRPFGNPANINVCGAGAIQLYNSVIRTGRSVGVVIDADATAARSEIVNVTFRHAPPRTSTGISLSPRHESAPRTLIKNTILTGYAQAIEQTLPSPGPGPFTEVIYSDFWDNVLDTNGPILDETNLFVDPVFVSDADLRLQPSSGLIDQGQPHSGLSEDFHGVSRPTGLGWDIGAYEHIPCGDGVVASDEECDDANDSDSDACLSTCMLAACGDGAVHRGVEDCDDQNVSNADACSNRCHAASCGDGLIHRGHEECDDGNQFSGDGCESDCTLSEHTDRRRGSSGGSGGCALGRGDAATAGWISVLMGIALIRHRRR